MSSTNWPPPGPGSEDAVPRRPGHRGGPPDAHPAYGGYGAPRPQGPERNPYAQTPYGPAQAAPGQPGPQYGQPRAWPCGTAGEQRPGGQAPPPARRRRRGLWVALGSVAVVVALGVVAALLLSGGPGTGAEPYRMVMPDSLLDGAYTRSAGSKDTHGEALSSKALAERLGISGATSVGAGYDRGRSEKIEVDGVYGRVADPARAVDTVFAAIDSLVREELGGSGVRVTDLRPPKAYDLPDSGGAVMKCAVKQVSGTVSGVPLSVPFPLCVWGDGSALGMVEHLVLPSSPADPGRGDTDAAAFAKQTAKIREEVRRDR